MGARLLLICGIIGLVMAGAPGAQIAKAKPEEKSGGFVSVPSPITSGVFRGVKREAEALLHERARVIVFEIQPGKSDYEECLKLATYIESIQGAQTVSYVPKPLGGHAVMVALAADELVMAEKSAIGDIGIDEKFITPVMHTGYSALARRKRPAYEALILGMLEKDHEVWQVRTAQGISYVLASELEKFERQQKVLGKQVVVPVGQFGYFSGEQAKSLELAKLLADSRAEVAAAYGLHPKTAIETVRLGVEWRPVLIHISGKIGPVLQEYVKRHVRAAQEDGKNFFIFEIDSYGGGLEGLEIAEFFADLRDVKTVAYIPRNAISAAAFIALGCDEIIMHRDAMLGDCGVMFVEGGQFHYVEAKGVSILSEKLAILAERKGYPPTLARAMIEKDLVVKEVRDRRTGRTLYLSDEQVAELPAENVEVLRVVKGTDRFLTMDGTAAQSLNFAKDLVDSFEGLCAYYGLEPEEVEKVNPNWVDGLIFFLNLKLVSILLIMGGIIGMYMELKLPGVALPGILAALCFLLFFWSHFLGGTATALEILLFLAGVLCLGLELFVIPGFGVFGFTGILLMVFSLIMASQTFVLPHSTGQWWELAGNLGSLLFAFVCLLVFAYFAGKYLPDVPLLGRVVLRPDQMMLASADPFGHSGIGLDGLVGAEGVALTTLRPAGRVRFGNQYVDVVTEGSYIDEGTRVRVIEVIGNRVVVKQV